MTYLFVIIKLHAFIHFNYERSFSFLVDFFGGVSWHASEIEGLKRKLTSKLGANSANLVPDWQVLSSIFLFMYD